MKIGLLKTTSGSEVWVSDKTYSFYREYIEKLGHEVCDIYISEKMPEELTKNNIELVFNATLGQYGEDGRVSAICDLLKIPHTHSDYISSGIAFDKLLTKIFFNQMGVKNAKYIVVTRSHLLSGEWKDRIAQDSYLKNRTQFFVKPLREGSTIDSWKIDINTDFNEFVFKSSCQEYLIEELIIGKEMCVGILNNKQIGVMEIRFDSEYYDYETKYTPGKNTHHIPNLNESLKNRMLNTCEKLHNFMGLNCLSRFDLLVQEDDFYVLEVNSNPAMTPTSLIPDLMRLQNIDLSFLIESLIKSAKFRIS